MTSAVMTPLTRRMVDALPRVRRYAHALTGDRRLGDRYVEVALAVLAEEPWHVRASGDVRCQLYRLIHRVIDALWMPETAAPFFAGEDARGEPAARLRALSLPARKLLLLTAVEGLSLARAAELVDLPSEVARVFLTRARMALADLPEEPRLPTFGESCPRSHSELAYT